MYIDYIIMKKAEILKKKERQEEGIIIIAFIVVVFVSVFACWIASRSASITGGLPGLKFYTYTLIHTSVQLVTTDATSETSML